MKKKIISILIGLSSLILPVKSQVSIEKAQAMYVYNFSRFIAWPDEYNSGNFVVGFLGASNLERELEVYCSTKKVGFQNIKIKKFENTKDISRCHILFISYGKTNKLGEVVSVIRNNNYSSLVVTEKRGAVEEGAVINFIIGESKLKFELNTITANKYGLRVSSKLEELADKVISYNTELGYENMASTNK